MTDHDLTTDGDVVPTLQQLIRARMDERGWNYPELARRSGNVLSRGRWQQLGTGMRLKELPEPGSLLAIAEALEVDVTTVLLAAGQSVGLAVRRRGPELAHLLPAGTDRLSPAMRDAILTIIRAAVTETLTADSDDEDGGHERRSADDEYTLDWAHGVGSVTRSNARPKAADRRT